MHPFQQVLHDGGELKKGERNILSVSGKVGHKKMKSTFIRARAWECFYRVSARLPNEKSDLITLPLP